MKHPEQLLESLFDQMLRSLPINGEPKPALFHPLFYTYPYALRFEMGNPEIACAAAWEAYCDAASQRAQALFRGIFSPEDEVLVIFDRTPDREVKNAFQGCRMQRVRARAYPAFLEDREEYDESWFYRYLYLGKASQIPAELVLQRIIEGEVLGGKHPYYSSCVYFYNVTKSLLFHMYDDRGADLIATSPDVLVTYYDGLNDMLLDYDREKMAEKLGM